MPDLFTRTSQDGIEVITVDGDIDVHSAPYLREALIDVINDGQYHTVIDLERCEYLDSTGMGVLVGGLKRHRAHDGTLSLVCTVPRLLTVLRITGLTKVFAIHDSLDSAVAELQPLTSRESVNA